jgi:hypothetical protein
VPDTDHYTDVAFDASYQCTPEEPGALLVNASSAKVRPSSGQMAVQVVSTKSSSTGWPRGWPAPTPAEPRPAIARGRLSPRTDDDFVYLGFVAFGQ